VTLDGNTLLDFHLVVPGQMWVADAHEICDRFEAALLTEVEGASVGFHIKTKHQASGSSRSVPSPLRLRRSPFAVVGPS
jgi:divalent metal cation (Fe/Co/Zn/Cd) transporter